MAYMTTAQALVKFLDNQYVSFDGKETKFVDGIFTIFGHGIVCGLGEALDSDRGGLTVYQGKNEQGMAHAATAFAKQNNRRKIIACSSSIGPGAANMVTAAATATVNHVPLLLFPADAFSTRQPDPVLQQFEQVQSLSITTNDAYKAVCRYWDRIARPEQLIPQKQARSAFPCRRMSWARATISPRNFCKSACTELHAQPPHPKRSRISPKSF